MPQPAYWFDDHCDEAMENHEHDRVYDVVPLDHPRCTVVLPFMHERFWVGMNGDWLTTHDRHGVWCLMNVYTERQIDLPLVATCNIWRNWNETAGPPEMYYKNWGPCLDLLKIVICEVPTEKGYYADYKLITLIDKEIAYLEGGSKRWKYLGDPDHFSYPCSCRR
jgi:hypothetical protein